MDPGVPGHRPGRLSTAPPALQARAQRITRGHGLEIGQSPAGARYHVFAFQESDDWVGLGL